MKPLAYLISSHFSYAPLALPGMLRSMRASGIPPEQIFVVLCGCVREFDQRGPDCAFWFVTHESRNFSTFVEAIDPRRAEALAPFDHVWALMDSSRAGPRFGVLSQEFDRDLQACGANPLPPTDRAMTDLAVYSLEFLSSQAELIATYKNVTHEVNATHEGVLFRRADRRAFFPGDGQGMGILRDCGPGMRLTADGTDIYGTGVLRITEHYHSVDYYHFKSNWGQHAGLLDRV